jgi:nuclear transport factor 2 (NTF2) superfamily protein
MPTRHDFDQNNPFSPFKTNISSKMKKRMMEQARRQRIANQTGLTYHSDMSRRKKDEQSQITH